MSDFQKLAELKRHRDVLAARLRETGSRVSNWTATDRQQFQTWSAEYDQAQASIVTLSASTTPQHPKMHLVGRDTGLPGYTGIMGTQSSTADADIALAAWMKNSAGLPLAMSDFETCQQYGQDPRSSGFEINLPTCTPRLGLNITNSLTTSGTDGGTYTVGGTFMTTVEMALKSFGPMLQVADITITADGRPMMWPTCDDTANEGVQVGETAESDVDTALTVGANIWGNYKYSSNIIKASHELVRDSAVNIASFVGNVCGERLGRIVNRRMTTGGGGGTIRGILTDAALGKTAASATAFTMDEVIDLVHSVDSAYRSGPGVGFMMNDLVMAYARKLKDGNGNYLWQDSLILGQPPTLMGYPVYANSVMADTLATGAKVVLFGKLNQYKGRIVSGVRFRQLNERYAENDMIGFLGFLECDGKLLKPSTSDSLCPVKYLQLA